MKTDAPTLFRLLFIHLFLPAPAAAVTRERAAGLRAQARTLGGN